MFIKRSWPLWLTLKSRMNINLSDAGTVAIPSSCECCQSREGAGRMSGTLHLAQALSNRGRRGRKTDFRDAERLVKRLVSQELILSFVPDAEQCLWRTQIGRASCRERV